MRASFCLVAAAAFMLPFIPASADEIVPTTYPFLPELVVNAEPDVCGPFHAVVTEAFKSRYYISVEDDEWPEAEITSLEFSALDVTEPEQPSRYLARFDGARMDRDSDEKDEVLAHVWWRPGGTWLRKYLVVYPDIDAFRRAKILAESIGPLPSEEELFEVAVAPVFAEALDITPDTGEGSEEKPITINRVPYLLTGPYPHQKMRLLRVEQVGKPVLVCLVELPDAEAAAGLLRSDLGKFIKLIRKVAGNEPIIAGTAHFLSQHLHAGDHVAVQSIVRPWILNDVVALNSRREIDAMLKDWALQSIWNHHQVALIPSYEKAARSTLFKYYRDAYDMDEDTAADLAHRVTDLILRSYFYTRGASWMSDNAGWRLRHALLNNRPLAEIATLLTQDALASDSDEVIEMEPVVCYALQNEALLAFVLEHGAKPNEANAFGKTALMYAAHLNLPQQAATLIVGGADVNAKTRGETPLFQYSIKYHERTALMYALENAGAEMVALLLKAGADPNARDSGKRDALAYLALNDALTKKERAEIEAMLREAGYRAAAP